MSKEKAIQEFIIEYAWHKKSCVWYSARQGDCDCGYTKAFGEVMTELEQQPDGVFEIRIPYLRQEEVTGVREAINKFAKELLNALTLKRAQNQN